jgi:hypothetical protein
VQGYQSRNMQAVKSKDRYKQGQRNIIPHMSHTDARTQTHTHTHIHMFLPNSHTHAQTHT